MQVLGRPERLRSPPDPHPLPVFDFKPAAAGWKPDPTEGYDDGVPGRRLNLPARILCTALTLVGPPALLIGLVPALLPAGDVNLTRAAALAALFWFTLAFFLAPAAFFFDLIGPIVGDVDGGGGLRTGSPPPTLPGPGIGGLPLPDADQSDTRLRDHDRPGRPARPRRPAKEPERRPRVPSRR